MSSGQSLRKGSSVEPGLPNTLRIPNERSRSSVACLTVTDAPAALGDLRSNADVSLNQGVSAATLSPNGGALHRRLTCRIRCPQLHAGAGIVGVNAELAAFEQRLNPAIGEFLRRRAMQFRGELNHERRLHRAMEDQPGIALDLGDVVAVVVDAVTIECQRRIAKQ